MYVDIEAVVCIVTDNCSFLLIVVWKSLSLWKKIWKIVLLIIIIAYNICTNYRKQTYFCFIHSNTIICLEAVPQDEVWNCWGIKGSNKRRNELEIWGLFLWVKYIWIFLNIKSSRAFHSLLFCLDSQTMHVGSVGCRSGKKFSSKPCKRATGWGATRWSNCWGYVSHFLQGYGLLIVHSSIHEWQLSYNRHPHHSAVANNYRAHKAEDGRELREGRGTCGQ